MIQLSKVKGNLELLIFDKIQCGLLTKLLPEKVTPYRTPHVFATIKYLLSPPFFPRRKQNTFDIRGIQRTGIIGVITAGKSV
jgi:hypothetical protein